MIHSQCPGISHPAAGPVVSPDLLAEDVDAPDLILIAEDDLFIGVQYEDALAQGGFRVLDVASTADEAVEAAQEHKPKLAIMDIRLAGPRDGVDAAIEIFTRFGIRCIFVTAHSDPEFRARAERARPLAWLSKPVSYQRLIETVRAAIATLA